MQLTNRLRAGALRHRLTIQAATAAPPGTYGEQALTWSTYATVWGKVEPLSAHESFNAGREEHTVTHIIVIRWLHGVLPGMRVKLSVDRFNRCFWIRGITMPDNKRATIALMCEEITPPVTANASIISFGGDDYASITNAASAGHFDFGTNSFTIEAWIYPTTIDYSDTSVTQNIISRWHGTYNFALSIRKGRACFVVNKLTLGYEDARCVTEGRSFPETVMIMPYVWTHIAGVCDRSAGYLYLYVNGTLVGSLATGTLETVTSTASIYLGCLSVSSPGYFFNGSIKQLRIWNGVARTAAQILANKDTDNLSGPTAGWALTGGSGTTATGYVTGCPTWTFGSSTAAPSWITMG